MFTQRTPKEFKLAERVYGDVKNAKAVRGKYGQAHTFVSWVAENGADHPAFTNIGRWRLREQASYNAEVYVPWITIDIDDVDLVEAYDNATTATENLLSWGYDPGRVICSFSGNKGFHIQVDSSQGQLSPFVGSIPAKCFLKTFCKEVCEGDFWDSAVCTPRSLIRLTGSTHGKSGLRKRSFTADHFLMKGLDGVMSEVRSGYDGFEWPDRGEGLDGPREHMISVSEQAESSYRNDEEYRSNPESSGGVMDRIKYGIREGQQFGDKPFHVGRENAAFIMGCGLIQNYGQHSQKALDKLKKWNGLNEPPLPLNRLKAQWRGAKRKMAPKVNKRR